MAKQDVAITVENSQEKAEATLLVQNSIQKVASKHDSNSASRRRKISTIDDHGPSEISTAQETHNPQDKSFFQKYWKKIFLASCVLAVLLDPLFLYVPIIKDDMKCLLLDRKLWIAALLLRLVTDVFYIVDIVYQDQCLEKFAGSIDDFRARRRHEFVRKHWLLRVTKDIIRSTNIQIDILAILPVPQVGVIVFFSKVRHLSSSKVIMNIIVLSQYVPRVLRIYVACKELKKATNGETRETAVWVKGALNFFMYILASHVLGAIWYFFGIQSKTRCWQSACGKEQGCDTGSFGCHDPNTFRNLTFLDDLCPISTPNTTLFDFGLYTSLLQFGITESTNYSQKFSNCFWWGLRNLSSLGSNLQPSIDSWENLFAAFISIIGLLLFLYLIGNLQTYMQLDTARIEANRFKMKVERKMEEKGEEVTEWLSKNGIPGRFQEDIKSQIMKKIQQELEENGVVDVENILSILPPKIQSRIRSYMPLTKLKQVPMLKEMDEDVLIQICQRLTPVKFDRNDIIFEEGEQLEMMILIVDGRVSIEKKDLSSNCQRGAGEVCGEKLLYWPALLSFPVRLPLVTESAKAVDVVEALGLSARDMESLGRQFRSKFRVQLGDDVEGECRVFTEEDLKKATDNYSRNRILGEGADSTVYKGLLLPDRVVAVKKAKTNLDGFQWESNLFVNEVVVASKMRHGNLVGLLGCCLETRIPRLVYEYMSNGNLYDHIHKIDGKGFPPLSLELRMQIAAGTARALTYLHSLTPNAIIHRDVKTRNILLDDIYTAKLSDFGASRLFTEHENEVATLVQGTLRYLDLEYLQSRILTRKRDVYGFGVVLAELLTSKKAYSPRRSEGESALLADLFVSSLEEGHLTEILDVEIINQGNLETAKKLAHLAKRCLMLKGNQRPSMKEVAQELEELQSIPKR